MTRTPSVRSNVFAALVCGIVAVFVGVPSARAVDTQMAISTTAIDFGQVNVGSTAQLSVTLTNTGPDDFVPHMFGGAPPTNEFNASQNCQLVTLPPGGSCQITYTFSPSGSGTFNDSSNFTISETDNQQDGEDFSVSLTGVGVALNSVSAAPLSHDFGNVNVGTTSPSLITTITNTGSANFGPINMFGGAPPSAEFSASQNCQGATLIPGGACSIFYTFSPTSPGIVNDTSVFVISPTTSQADGTQFTVTLTGCGVAAGGPCAPPESTRVIPAAGSTPGNFGSFFRTGVQLSNLGTTAITGRFIYHPAGVSGSSTDPSLSFTVGPNGTISYDDLVQTMGQGGLGSLDVVVPAGSNIPVIVARVYNDAGASGTSGFTEEAIDPNSTDTRVLVAGSTSLLVAPPNNTTLRFNIGVRTLLSGATVHFQVRDENGTVVNTVTKEYDPTFYEQQSATTYLGAALPPNASIQISVTSGSAIIYGATIDNVTNDPSIQFARVISP